MLKLMTSFVTMVWASAFPFSALGQSSAEPLALEELPAAAILRVVPRWGQEQLNPDGSVTKLSPDRKQLWIQKFNQVRKIDLPVSVSGMSSRLEGVVQLYGPYNKDSNSYDMVYVHVVSGKVHSKSSVEKSNLMTVANTGVIVSQSRYERFHPRTGELLLIAERSGNSNSTSYSTYQTSSGSILIFEGRTFRVDRNGEWSSLPMPPGVTHCQEFEGETILDCGGNEGRQRYLTMSHGQGFKSWDVSGKTVLASHAARGLVVWINELTSVDPQLLRQLNVTDLHTGVTRQVPFAEVDPHSSLDFFIRISAEKMVLWFRNKDLSVVSPAEFWSAFDAKALHELQGKGRRLGNARSIADVTPLLQDEYQDLGADRSEDGWRVSVREGIFTYGRVGDDQLHRIFLGSQPSISVIPRTSMAYMQFRTGTNSFNVLYDLETGRAYELGAGYMGIESSERGDQFVVQRNSDEWLISRRRLREVPNWRTGLISAPARPDIPIAVLQSCEIADEKPSLAASLLRLRTMPGNSVDEHELARVLEYELTPGELVLVAHVLQKYLAVNPLEAQLAFRRLNLAERLRFLPNDYAASPCLSEQDRLRLREQVTRLFTEIADQNQVGIDIYSFQHLVALQPLVREFRFANDSAEDIIVDKLAKAAELHPQLQGVFPSKLYYFAKAIANPIFGRPVKFKTDVTVNQDRKVSHVTLLSTVPAYGQKVRRNSFGFYHGVISSMEVKGNVGARGAERFAWRAMGQRFAADVTLTKSGDLSHLVPPTDSVNHTALNRDGRLVGMMVVGTNMGKNHSLMTMGQYEFWYRQKGYTFEPVSQVPNSLEFMRRLISSGELDYLVKEAHSDGDERNLFRAARVGELRTGHRKSADGSREETIYLLSPKYGQGNEMVTSPDGSDDLIPNQLFGEWVRAREAAGQGPLVYLNASCTSTTKVVNEITATRSNLLIAIPSVTAISMFRSSSTNSTAVFIDGLHEGLSWKEIRQRMENDPEVKAERNNLFALPNEERFDRVIRKALGFTVDVDVRLTDLKMNRSFSVDEFNRDH